MGLAGRDRLAYVGTSGWKYPHWRKGAFYPLGLAQERELAFLARRLDGVEVNGTFYGLVRPDAFRRWRAEVPERFVFAVKASRYITHMLELGKDEAPIANFFAQGVLLLGKQLGPILWQLPERLHFDEPKARAFFQLLPRTMREAEACASRHDVRMEGRCVLVAPDGRRKRLRHVLEVRHASWLEPGALALLRRHEIGLVIAETAGKFPLSYERTLDDLVYVRLHGSQKLYASRYSMDELELWATRIREWTAEGALVHVYFDNDARAFAPSDARVLRALVRGEAPPERTHGPVDERRDAWPAAHRAMRKKSAS